jgi:hypothetical protein
MSKPMPISAQRAAGACLAMTALFAAVRLGRALLHPC